MFCSCDYPGECYIEVDTIAAVCGEASCYFSFNKAEAIECSDVLIPQDVYEDPFRCIT